MKKFVITAVMLLTLIALTACSGNSDTAELTPTLPPTQNGNNQANVVDTGTPTENVPAEELIIQIDIATDEVLSTFTNLHHVSLGESGVRLVVWANKPLPHLAVITLVPELLEDRNEWGFSPRDSVGYVEMLLPGEGYVINNYMGLGTLPHMGIGFFDEDIRDTRIFFFQENHAYPEHGDRWVIREIETDRILWGFPGGGTDPQYEGDYAIVINGVGFRSTGGFYTVAGEQFPTHVTMAVLWQLGLDTIQGGSQVSLQHNGEGIGIGLNVVNYLASGADRVDVGINDTFMADDGLFTQYIPISLLRQLGFDVYFEGGRVHIGGALNVAVNPHPLAVALQNFIDNAEGETKALVANVGSSLGVVAIEIVDGFAEATIYVSLMSGLIYKEIGSIEGSPFSLGFTTEGWSNPVKTTADGGNRSYTMISIGTSPEIIYLYTLYDEPADDGSRNFYLFNGGWLEGIEGGRNPIAEEVFNSLRDSMGVEIISWRDLPDSSEEVLSWVILDS